jgi:hypothetical protein
MASSVIEPAHSGDEIDSKLNRIQNGADRLNFWAGVLGLSIARRAIELHKGAIRAKNADPGLEIELELPVTQTSEASHRSFVQLPRRRSASRTLLNLSFDPTRERRHGAANYTRVPWGRLLPLLSRSRSTDHALAARDL